MNKFWSRACKFKPPLIFNGIMMVLTASASLIAVVIGDNLIIPDALVYVLYASAFAFLSLTVWAIVIFVRDTSPTKQFQQQIHKIPFAARLVDDDAYRIRISSSVSLVTNSLLAASKAVAGWFFASTWQMVLSIYYIVLCVMKFMILRNDRRVAQEPDANIRARKEWQVYRFCGMMLIALTAALQGVVIKIVQDGATFAYNNILILAIAAYDFYCLIASIVYMVRRRKKHTPATVAIKVISFATSLVAILSLQTAMFASFGVDMELKVQQLMNVLTGSAVCLMLLATGIHMVIQATRQLNAEA